MSNYTQGEAVSNYTQEDVARAWDYGFSTGKSRAMRHMSDEPTLSLNVPNPYRADTSDVPEWVRDCTHDPCAAWSPSAATCSATRPPQTEPKRSETTDERH